MFKSFLITETEWGLPTMELTLNGEKYLTAVIDNAFSAIAVMDENMGGSDEAEIQYDFLDGI